MTRIRVPKFSLNAATTATHKLKITQSLRPLRLCVKPLPSAGYFQSTVLVKLNLGSLGSGALGSDVIPYLPRRVIGPAYPALGW
jgi:hypothetical protein